MATIPTTYKGKVYKGPSILEMTWAALDEFYDTLKSYDDLTEDKPEVQFYKGKCSGVAVALSILLNPYDPDVDEVRAECHERWKARQ